MYTVLDVETEVLLYYRLNVCVPPKSTGGTLILNVKAFGGVAFGR